MAADQTVVRTGTKTLVAGAAWVMRLTGNLDDSVELIHHGDSSSPIYYLRAATEAALTTLGAKAVAAAEHPVLLSGERLMVGVPTDGLWVRLLSAGTPTVTVNGDF